MRSRCPNCGKRFASRPRLDQHITAETLQAVKGLEADGLVQVNGSMVSLTEHGREIAKARKGAA